MTSLLRGCLGVLLVPWAALFALVGLAAASGEDAVGRGLGWLLVIAAALIAATALRLVRGGLRGAIGAPLPAPASLVHGTVTRAQPATPTPTPAPAVGPSSAPGRRRSEGSPARGAAGPLALLALVVAAGTAASLAGPAGLVLLVPLHVLAALLPARAITRHVARHQGGPPPRLVGRGLAWGGVGATAIAFAGELAAGTALALVVWLALGASPGAREAVGEVVGTAIESMALEPAAAAEAIARLDVSALMRPSIALAIVGLLGLVGPLVEELAKLAGVVALGPRTRPRAFLAGAAVGAGFGVLEALLIGAAGLGPAWVLAILARAAATLMHATASGLAALGWFAVAAEGRARAGVGFVAASVALHAVWNLGVVTAVLSSAAVAEGAGPAWLGRVAVTAPLAVSLAFAVALGTFTALSGRLGREAPAGQDAAASGR